MALKLDPVPEKGQSRDDWGKVKSDVDAPAQSLPLVKVRCIVYSFPWTNEKGLAPGEVAEVPSAIAELMLAKRQVEIVEQEEKDK
jgi:hypothetical protein